MGTRLVMGTVFLTHQIQNAPPQRKGWSGTKPLTVPLPVGGILPGAGTLELKSLDGAGVTGTLAALTGSVLGWRTGHPCCSGAGVPSPLRGSFCLQADCGVVGCRQRDCRTLSLRRGDWFTCWHLKPLPVSVQVPVCI